MRGQGLGSTVTDVEPLAGGTQNIVVRLRVNDRRLVLRRPPPHPRANSNRTMQREIAVLRTLAGSGVPHPGFVAGCEDLAVLGVVFYLMEDVDGFNPGTDVAPAYAADPQMRHRVGLNYAAALAGLSRAPGSWRPPAGGIAAPGFLSGAPGSGLSRTAGELPPRALRPGVARRRPARGAGSRSTAHLTASRGSCTATRTSTTPCCVATCPRSRPSSTGRCAPSAIRCSTWAGSWCAGPHDPDPINAGRELAALGGLPSRTELLAAYADAGGRSAEHLDWYVAMACFKLAIVIEGTYSRFLAGQAHRESGERLHDSASRLIGLGERVAAGDNPFT